MKKRPVGFTILSFIGMFIILKGIIWFCLMARHDSIFNNMARGVCFLLTILLVYGLWSMKRWTFYIYVLLVLVSQSFIFIEMNTWPNMLFMSIVVLLFSLFIYFFVGAYIHGKLKENYYSITNH